MRGQAAFAPVAGYPFSSTDAQLLYAVPSGLTTLLVSQPTLLTASISAAGPERSKDLCCRQIVGLSCVPLRRYNPLSAG